MKVFITVKPKSHKEHIEKIDDQHYVISTQKIPEKGKANEDIVRILAKHFNISKSKVILISGFTSRNKSAIIDL